MQEKIGLQLDHLLIFIPHPLLYEPTLLALLALILTPLKPPLLETFPLRSEHELQLAAYGHLSFLTVQGGYIRARCNQDQVSPSIRPRLLIYMLREIASTFLLEPLEGASRNTHLGASAGIEGGLSLPRCPRCRPRSPTLGRLDIPRYECFDLKPRLISCGLKNFPFFSASKFGRIRSPSL